jgi:hypothetical protein
MHASFLDSADLQLRQFICFHHTFKFDGNGGPFCSRYTESYTEKTEDRAILNEPA